MRVRERILAVASYLFLTLFIYFLCALMNFLASIKVHNSTTASAFVSAFAIAFTTAVLLSFSNYVNMCL